MGTLREELDNLVSENRGDHNTTCGGSYEEIFAAARLALESLPCAYGCRPGRECLRCTRLRELEGEG